MLKRKWLAALLVLCCLALFAGIASADFLVQTINGDVYVATYTICSESLCPDASEFQSGLDSSLTRDGVDFRPILNAIIDKTESQWKWLAFAYDGSNAANPYVTYAKVTGTLGSESMVHKYEAYLQKIIKVDVVQVPTVNNPVYNGQEQKPVPEDGTYTVTYSPSVVKNAGDYTATLTLVSGFGLHWEGGDTSAKEINFTITPKPLTDANVTLDPETFTYDGSAHTPGVKCDGTPLLQLMPI